jgi:hypothetical protein
VLDAGCALSYNHLFYYHRPRLFLFINFRGGGDDSEHAGSFLIEIGAKK